MIGEQMNMVITPGVINELESRNGNVHGQTNGRKTDNQTDGITLISKAT